MVLLNLGCGKHKLDGFINLDKDMGWAFESGLDFKDGSVDGITISHALMYVHDNDWMRVFHEFYRVLRDGGVLRITEDNTADPESERYGGHFDAVSMTYPEKIADYLVSAGFKVYAGRGTMFMDNRLMQSFHGMPPKVFHIEGIK